MNKKKAKYLIILGLTLIILGVSNEVFAPMCQELDQQATSGCTYPTPGIEYYIPLIITIICAAIIVLSLYNILIDDEKKVLTKK